MLLHLTCFAPQEFVYSAGDQSTHMYIIRRGVVGANGRVMGSGKYFGEDMILRSSTRLFGVCCLTYLDVYTLAETDLREVLQDGQYPTIYKAMRRSVMKLAFRQNVVRYLSNVEPQLRAAGIAAAAISASGPETTMRVSNQPEAIYGGHSRLRDKWK